MSFIYPEANMCVFFIPPGWQIPIHENRKLSHFFIFMLQYETTEKTIENIVMFFFINFEKLPIV